MWNRKELKQRAKAALKANYWRCVVAALIISVLTVGTTYSVRFSNYSVRFSNSHLLIQNVQPAAGYGVSGAETAEADRIGEMMQEIILGNAATAQEQQQRVLLFLALFGAVMLIIMAVGICLKAFVLDIFRIGGCGFFTGNARQPAKLGELLVGFQHNYFRNVVTMFLKGLYIFLWSLLLVIPGIVKAYSYAMVPYILADFPDMPRKEAFAMSRRMMDGNKWRTFVLELSFFGWTIVAALTFNIAGIFFVKPYIEATMAELYLALRGEAETAIPAPEF